MRVVRRILSGMLLVVLSSGPVVPGGPIQVCAASDEPYDPEVVIVEELTELKPRPGALPPTQLGEQPSSVVIVPREAIERSRASTLEDVLSFAPGVFSNPAPVRRTAGCRSGVRTSRPTSIPGASRS